MIFLKFKNNYFFLFYKRKLIFKKFGFKNQEKDDNSYLDNILDKITGVKKYGTMSITDLWPDYTLKKWLKISKFSVSKHLLKDLSKKSVNNEHNA